MKKAMAVLTGAVALAALAPAAAGAAGAAPVVCNGTLQGRIVGAVQVPYGADCTLSKVVVLGDVTTEQDVGTVTLDRTVVDGDVTLLGASALTVAKSAVNGSLSSREAYGDVKVTRSSVRDDATFVATAGEVHLGNAAAGERGNVFGGSVLVDRTFGAGTVDGNVVGERLTLTGNFAPLTLSRNLVIRAIDCSDNAVDPTGSANTAGSKLGQCAGV